MNSSTVDEMKVSTLFIHQERGAILRQWFCFFDFSYSTITCSLPFLGNKEDFRTEALGRALTSLFLDLPVGGSALYHFGVGRRKTLCTGSRLFRSLSPLVSCGNVTNIPTSPCWSIFCPWRQMGISVNLFQPFGNSAHTIVGYYNYFALLAKNRHQEVPPTCNQEPHLLLTYVGSKAQLRKCLIFPGLFRKSYVLFFGRYQHNTF